MLQRFVLGIVERFGLLTIVVAALVLFYEGVFFLNWWPLNKAPYAGPIIEGRVSRVARVKLEAANARAIQQQAKLRGEAIDKIAEIEDEALARQAEIERLEDYSSRALSDAIDAARRAQQAENAKPEVIVRERVEYVPIPEPVPVESERVIVREAQCPTPQTQTKVVTRYVKADCPNPLFERVDPGVLRSLRNRAD